MTRGPQGYGRTVAAALGLLGVAGLAGCSSDPVQEAFERCKSATLADVAVADLTGSSTDPYAAVRPTSTSFDWPDLADLTVTEYTDTQITNLRGTIDGQKWMCGYDHQHDDVRIAWDW